MADSELQGGAELSRTLTAAAEGLTDFSRPNRDVASIAARSSAALAPVRSGKLKRTITASGSKTAAIIRAGAFGVPYAGPIHWGWPGRHILPQPFLSDGTQNSEGRWIPVYESYVDEYLSTIKGA